MTREELVLISAYTGFMLIPSGEFGQIHGVVERVMGRPVWTHEFAFKPFQEKMRESLWPEIEKIINKAFSEAPPLPETAGGGRMNREDAAREIDNTACCFSDKRFRDAMHMAAAALRGPQADPDTGLVPCGCGGKAKITEQSLNWLIKCVECGIQLEVYGGRGGAVWSWNRAMGWEDKG